MFGKWHLLTDTSSNNNNNNNNNKTNDNHNVVKDCRYFARQTSWQNTVVQKESESQLEGIWGGMV